MEGRIGRAGVFVAIFAAGCMTTTGGADAPDLSVPVDLRPFHDFCQLPCDPDCPSGSQGPDYCLTGSTQDANCGSCATPGKMCEYYEAELTCGNDHLWRCTWCGGSNCGAVCQAVRLDLSALSDGSMSAD